MAHSITKVEKYSLTCRMLIYALILTLVFEGILRKLVPSIISIGFFFLKDIICFTALYLVFDKKFKRNTGKLYNMWKTLFFTFIPLIIYTGSLDLVLIVWGTKQYLLYAVTAILLPSAFPPNKEEEFKKFCSFLVFLLIPTTMVAILQHSLPASHWLNQSIGGGNLESFSAAGHLRVSSTFSFTGQFSWFLNLVCVFLMIYFFLRPSYSNGFLKKVEKIMPLVLGVLLIVGAFITGGRNAVLGCGSCLFLGLLISGFKRFEWLFSKGIGIVIFVAACLFFLGVIRPDFFEAYQARSQGTQTMSHSQEMQGRVFSQLTNWIGGMWNPDLSSTIFGNGLGVMSNGSDQISSYAKNARSNGLWTETDMASTFWEGGMYLILIWYGFRLLVIIFCIRIWLSLKNTSYALAASFLISYITITGILGTLGIQPPIAIWWFLSIGALIAIKNFDDARHNCINKRFSLVKTHSNITM